MDGNMGWLRKQLPTAICLKLLLRAAQRDQIIACLVGGDQLRLQLSNEYSDAPLQIKSVYIADAQDSCDINAKTARYLTFGKKRNVRSRLANR